MTNTTKLMTVDNFKEQLTQDLTNSIIGYLNGIRELYFRDTHQLRKLDITEILKIIEDFNPVLVTEDFEETLQNLISARDEIKDIYLSIKTEYDQECFYRYLDTFITDEDLKYL